MAMSLSWYGNCFGSKRIPNMPQSFSVSVGVQGAAMKDYSLDYAESGDEQDCREVVMESRAGGDNVGLGEYTEDENFLYLFGPSEVFKIKDERGLTCAFLVVQPCMLARSWDCCLARIHVFRVSELQRNIEFYRQLLQFGVKFAGLMDAGYTRCVVCVASVLPEITQVARQQGFLIVGSIPDGVNLARTGACEDLIMVNSLGIPNRPRRSSEKMSVVVNQFMAILKAMPSYDASWNKTTNKFLPQTYIFSNGLRTTVRWLEPDDVDECYSIFSKAAEKGDGYGLDDCPSKDIFYHTKLRGGYSVVITTESDQINDTTATGSKKKTTNDGSKLVSFIFVNDAWYARNPDACLGETSFVISEEFRGRGLAREIIAIEMALLKELGYEGMLNDTLLSNSRMQSALKGNAFPSVIVGVIPDGTLTANYGWDDQIIDYTDFKLAGTSVKTLTEMAKLSHDRSVRKATSTKLSKL